jgi:hypothetical protein
MQLTRPLMAPPMQFPSYSAPPLRRVVPFSRAAMLARAANVRPTTIGTGRRVFGVPGAPRGLRLGNMPAELSDYINSPGTPGSSTFFLYGLGQDDSMIPTDNASAMMAPATDVTTSTSPSFMTSIESLFTTATDAAKTIVPAVLQQQRASQAQADLTAGKITPAQYNQIVGTPLATFGITPSAGLAQGLKIGGGTLAILGVAALALMFIRKRR